MNAQRWGRSLVLLAGLLPVNVVVHSGCGQQHQYGVGQDGSEDHFDFDKAVQDEEQERHHRLRQQQASVKPTRGE